MEKLKIKVAFYNQEEKKKFKKNYPNEFPLLDKIAGKPIEVALDDFRAYFLFRHQNVNPGSVSFRDFLKKLSTQWGCLVEYFKYTKASENFNAIVDSNGGNNEVSEGLGVAGGLVVTSKIFLNTTQADWRKIDVQQTKDFDFAHIASDGKKYIIVECKGSIVKDNTHLAEISSHKGDILEKKANKDFKKKYSKKSHFYFGAITAADKKNQLTVRLVDPPVNEILMEPRKYKLLSRLYYYYDIISVISPRSFLTLSLANRIKVLSEVNLYNELDGISLVDNYLYLLSVDSYFIFTKTRDKNSLIGTSLLAENGDLFFIGLHLDTLRILIRQDFKSILSFKVDEPSTQEHDMTIVLNSRNYYQKKFMEENLPQIKPRFGLYQIKKRMSVSISSSGIIYGHLSKKEFIKQ